MENDQYIQILIFEKMALKKKSLQQKEKKKKKALVNF